MYNVSEQQILKPNVKNKQNEINKLQNCQPTNKKHQILLNTNNIKQFIKKLNNITQKQFKSTVLQASIIRLYKFSIAYDDFLNPMLSKELKLKIFGQQYQDKQCTINGRVIKKYIKKHNQYVFKEQNKILLENIPNKNYNHQQFEQQIINLHNKSCLGCIKQFQQGQRLPKTNQPYSFVNGTRYNERLFEKKLKQKICALLNCRGGYLFVVNSIKPQIRGLSDQKRFYIEKIKEVTSLIFPNQFYIQSSIINVIDKKNLQKNSLEKQKYVIRISLVAKKRQVLYSEEQKYIKSPSTFLSYFLSFEEQKNQNNYYDIKILKQQKKLYQIMHQRIIFQKKNSKENFGLFSRNQFQLKCIKNLIKQYVVSQSYLKNSPLIEKDQQPIISFKNNSLLIFANESLANINQIHIAFLNQQKNQHRIVKPYQSYQNKIKKSIWFISHQYSSDFTKNIIYTTLQNKNTPIFITCTKYLTIKKKQISEFKDIFLTYKSKFNKLPQGYLGVEPNSYQKQLYNFYMKFETFQQITFIYILLQNQGMRCFFIKQTQYKQGNKQNKKDKVFDLKQKLMKQFNVS